MVGTGGGFSRRGSLIRDGEPLAVIGAEMLVSVDDDSLRCPAAEVSYHLAEGGVMIVRIDVIGGMLGVTQQRCGWESVGDTSVDGKPGGWGFLEVNLNPRNRCAAPAFALVDGLTNGIVRELRRTIATVFVPELSTAGARDAAALVDRILCEFIVEEEQAAGLSAEFGGRFRKTLVPETVVHAEVTPLEFHALRRHAEEAVRAAAGSDVGADRARCQRLTAIEHEFLERVDQLRVAAMAEGTDEAATATATYGCSVTNEQVTNYFRQRLRRSPALVVHDLMPVPGGRSKETILVSLGGTTELPSEVIIRMDRPVGLLQTRSADEFAVLEAVYAYGGVPVPEPFFAEEEGHGLGAGTFQVLELVPGHKAGEYFPDLAAPAEHQREIGFQLAVALARLHSLPLDRLAGTRLDIDGATVTEASIVATVDGMVARVNELTGPACATVPLAHRCLLDHVADVVPAPRLTLLQGDFGFHNIVVSGDRVTALVDWEVAAIGPPVRELASGWNAITWLMPWSEFVKAYVDAGGLIEDCDPRGISFYRVLSALGGFMSSRMGGRLFRTGVKRDLLTAHSGLDSHFRCARNLARSLDDAMSASP
jgi:aminoglycoside phosphotransferase (APT) family kinase protein